MTDEGFRTRPAERRIVALDALRGIAVLGILMLNVQTFAMVVEAYGDPLSHMDFSDPNRAVWAAGHIFFELKFITLFAVLFGAGLAMNAVDAEHEAAWDAAVRRWRRLAWLFLFGLIHAFAIWYGDILASYAIWGAAAAFFLTRRPGPLIYAGIVLTGVTAALFWTQYNEWVGTADIFAASSWRPSASELAAATEIARASWAERIAESAARTAEMQAASLVYYGPRVLGCMLIGIGLYRTGFLTGAWRARTYALCAAAGLALGLGAFALTAQGLIQGGFTPRALRWAAPLDHMASLPAAFGYASLVMLAAKAGALRWLVAPFAAVGRMALTNYIAQSVICALVFFGPPGLGLFGTVERTGQLAIVLAIWAAQLVWSPLWLAAFRFGPLEWLWRSLTYGRPQPMLTRRTET